MLTMNKLVFLHQALMVSLYNTMSCTWCVDSVHVTIWIHVIAGHITYVLMELTNHINYAAS